MLTNGEKTVLIDALRTTYRLAVLLQQLGLPRSSYFYHAARLKRPGKYQQSRRTISEVFELNKRRYGYRRIGVVLRRGGESVSEKVIRRIMFEDRLVVCTRRRRRYASYNGEITPAVENIVERNFHADAPNQTWLTDITEFQIPAGKVYPVFLLAHRGGLLPRFRFGYPTKVGSPPFLRYRSGTLSPLNSGTLSPLFTVIPIEDAITDGRDGYREWTRQV